MENLTNIVEKITQQIDEEKDKLQQISKFDETIKMLGSIVILEKPTYSFPLIDTLGKQTYSNLNRR